MLLCACMQAFAVGPAARSSRRKLRSRDLSQHGENVVLVMHQPHNIKGNFHRRIRASTCGTGHFLLDQENAQYQLRVTDPTRLELLDSTGNDIASRIGSSMGILRLRFPCDLTCTTSVCVFQLGSGAL